MRDGVEGSSQKPLCPHPVPTLLHRGSRAGREQSADRGGTSQDKPDGDCACSCCTVRRLLLAGNWISMHACGADNATVVTVNLCVLLSVLMRNAFEVEKKKQEKRQNTKEKCSVPAHALLLCD